MKQNQTLSIVVPIFNRAATLVRCLDSIASQAGIGRCRLILVDNASDDCSLSVMTQWCERHTDIDTAVVTEKRRGASIARNAGLALAESPWVMFFDSDDIMLPGHVGRLLKAIDHRPDIELFGWDISCQLPDGKRLKARFFDKHPLSRHLCHTGISTLRFAVRTDLLRRVGRWNESIRGWDDFELGVRLLLARPNIAKLADPAGCPLARAFFTEQSITGSCYSAKAAEWEAALDAVEVALRSEAPRMLPWVAFRRAVLSGFYAREHDAAAAQRLMKKAKVKGFGRVKAAIVYMVIRVFGRGAPSVGRFLIQAED